MYRTVQYTVLFVVLALIQIFIFNNLTLGVLFAPMVYVTFIVLLPLDIKPIVSLAVGLAMGLVMDFTMGSAGLSTIATLLVAFLRPYIATSVCSRECVVKCVIPSIDRMGVGNFLRFATSIVVIHATAFFVLESLSAEHIFRTILRIVISSAATVLVVWVTAKLLSSKLDNRL